MHACRSTLEDPTSLWYAYATRIGDAFATVCTNGAGLATFTAYAVASPYGPGGPGGTAAGAPPAQWQLRPNVVAALRGVCARQESGAGYFFDAIMGPGSSLANERTAFIETFSKDGNVRDMTVALLLNPYFLLER